MNANTILLVGLTAVLGVVEAAASPGPFALTLADRPEAAARELRVRVRAALAQCGFDSEGVAVSCSGTGYGMFDLAVAVAVLAALGRIPASALAGTAFLGELSLTGALRPVRGVLPALRGAAALGFRRVVVPAACVAEAALVDGIEVLVAGHLSEVVEALSGGKALSKPEDAQPHRRVLAEQFVQVDLADVRGNLSARRALEVAAAGGHGLLLVGAPGAGKTMLARRLTTILPRMTDEEALDATALYSVAGLLQSGHGRLRERPFRAPHHTCSAPGLVGGGDPIRPGEVSLAHNGVLFLDEVDQFKRGALEALDYVLRDGKADIVRSKTRASFPAQPLVVAACGPCPCGFRGDGQARCTCSEERATMYRARSTGFAPRAVDIAVRLAPVDMAQLVKGPPGESSAAVRERVLAARGVQAARYARKEASAPTNAALPGEEYGRRGSPLDAKAREVLYQAVERLPLTPAQTASVVRVARTVADLDESDAIQAPHVAEAVCYVPARAFS